MWLVLKFVSQLALKCVSKLALKFVCLAWRWASAWHVAGVAGMMGSIEPGVRQALIRATLHLVNREYELLAEDFVALGLLPRGSDMDAVIPALTGKRRDTLCVCLRLCVCVCCCVGVESSGMCSTRSCATAAAASLHDAVDSSVGAQLARPGAPCGVLLRLRLRLFAAVPAELPLGIHKSCGCALLREPTGGYGGTAVATKNVAAAAGAAGVFQTALAGGVSNISFSTLSADLGRTMYKYSFRLPPYYTLLVRSLSVLEGIALASDPNYKVGGLFFGRLRTPPC